MKNLSFLDMPHYAVTKCGKVFNNKKDRFIKGTTTSGYRAVTLTNKEGWSKPFLVHRLVAEAYIPNPESKKTVNHKDGDKKNNSVSNLEWATYSEQVIHAIEAGLRPKRQNQFGKGLTEYVVIKICQMCEQGFRNKDIVNILGVSPCVVSDIRSGNSYKDISCDFNLTKFPSTQRVSGDKVIKICDLLSEGLSVNKVRNLVNTSHLTVKNIKLRKTYTSISNNYEW